ncbi:MAG: hypothetical protein AMJ54_00030 [Deltaproteobacteria bacterium SG8_13]|nr:MAG: hypothetical protein AMJ54_00030 [Deltaproteobacteria bacterium SG8_13]
MIPSLYYLDRYRNEGTRTYSVHADFTEAQQPYRPDSKHSRFALPSFEVPRDQMLVYTAHPSVELQQTYLRAETVLFCIHPQVLEHYPDDPYIKRTLSIGTPCGGIAVAPSSSTRTLYVDDDNPPHAVKVHFPFRISRYHRRMRQEVVEQAVVVSRELERAVGCLDDRFAFCREVIGLVHKDLQPETPRGENWGYLVRDMQPFPVAAAERNLVPGFSLYGTDFFEPATTPLLFELMGNKDPREFVLNEIMIPIIRHWVGCFQHFGYLLEPHGQNVLLEVNKDLDITRIVHRDLSIGIDMRRRRERNLPDGNLNAYNRMETDEFHSIVYDMFMGGHFFDRLVALCLEKYPNLQKEDFCRPCRDEFARILPDHEKYFPKTIQYFSEKRDRFGKPLFEDTGKAPQWRP